MLKLIAFPKLVCPVVVYDGTLTGLLRGFGNVKYIKKYILHAWQLDNDMKIETRDGTSYNRIRNH